VIRWYYSTNGKAEGPVAFEFLIEQLKAGKFRLIDLVFKEGESAWKTFGEIPEFREAYQAPPPLVPPVPTQPTEVNFDDISIDDFTPTPILTQTAPAVTAVPVNREEPVQRVAVAAPVQPLSQIVVPESTSVKGFEKPEEGWPSDWRLSSSWIVLRKKPDGSGYEQEGPYSAEHIIEMIGTGKIEYSQYCWKPGYTRWFRIGNLPEFDRRKRDRDNDTVNQIIPVPSIAEALPVGREFGCPRPIQLTRQHQRIRAPLGCPPPCRGDVGENSRTQIEGRELDARRCGEADPPQRVDHCERLDRLRRVEIVSLLLVCEVQAWTDNRHAPHRSGAERSIGSDRSKRLFDAELDGNRRIGRQPAVAEDRDLVDE